MLLYLHRDDVPKDMLLATQYYRFRSTPIINFQRQACQDLGRVAGGAALLTPVEMRQSHVQCRRNAWKLWNVSIMDEINVRSSWYPAILRIAHKMRTPNP